jgi:hypothetical protein
MIFFHVDGPDGTDMMTERAAFAGHRINNKPVAIPADRGKSADRFTLSAFKAFFLVNHRGGPAAEFFTVRDRRLKQ